MTLAAPAAPCLSSQEIDAFRNDGFLVVDEVFDEAEVTVWRELIESPAVLDSEKHGHLAESTLHLLELTAKHPSFLNLARDPRIVGRLQDLMGPDIALSHSKLAAQAKTAGKGGFGWHQDFAFFPHTNTNLIAVMVMLDDATPENGCMRMVRGSHGHGLLNHADSGGNFTYQCQEKSRWESRPDLVTPITPRAGGISLHHCLTLHGSGPNPSGLPRRGLVFQYRADDAYQLADTVFTDTGLLISGERRGLVRCETAIWRLPMRPERRDGRGFGSAWNQMGEFAIRCDEGE